MEGVVQRGGGRCERRCSVSWDCRCNLGLKQFTVLCNLYGRDSPGHGPWDSEYSGVVLCTIGVIREINVKAIFIYLWCFGKLVP